MFAQLCYQVRCLHSYAVKIMSALLYCKKCIVIFSERKLYTQRRRVFSGALKGAWSDHFSEKCLQNKPIPWHPSVLLNTGLYCDCHYPDVRCHKWLTHQARTSCLYMQRTQAGLRRECNTDMSAFDSPTSIPGDIFFRQSCPHASIHDWPPVPMTTISCLWCLYWFLPLSCHSCKCL